MDRLVHVPAAHVPALRRSLAGAAAGCRAALVAAAPAEAAGHALELADLYAALAQLPAAGSDGPCPLRAHPEVLVDALHGAAVAALGDFMAALDSGSPPVASHRFAAVRELVVLLAEVQDG